MEKLCVNNKKILFVILISFHCVYCYSNCSIDATNDVLFGAYVPPAAKTTTGSITISCSPAERYSIDLSTGNSGSYPIRQLDSGGNTLDYNLYTDAAYSIIWGNGLGPTGHVLEDVAAAGGVYTIYGRIYPGQSPASGVYTDAITITLTYPPV